MNYLSTATCRFGQTFLILILLLIGSSVQSQVNFGPKTLVSDDLSFVYDLIAEDIDLDGDVDLLSSSYTDDKIAWYENLGGSFGPQQIIDNTAVGIATIRVADLTGDGVPDLAATLSISHKTVYYPGLGGGAFGPQVIVSDTFEHARALALADIDGDGPIDMIVGNEGSGVLNWYRNLGGGVFDNPVLIDSTGEFLGLINAIAEDFDNDGDIDVSCTVLFGTALFWYENLGGGVFSSPQYVGMTSLAIAVSAGDVTGDGKMELFYAGINIRWWENLGPGGGAAGDFGPANTLASSYIFPGDIELADLDGDGDKDAIGVSINNSQFGWFENTGAGIDPVEISIDTTTVNPSIIAAADFDNDGDIDIAVCSYGDDEINWWENLSATCSTNDKPENLIAIVGPTTLDLSWDKVDQSVGCQVSATRLTPPGPSISKNLLGFEVDNFSVPVSAPGAGTTWQWSVRCACTLSPISATSFSMADTFSIPLLMSGSKLTSESWVSSTDMLSEGRLAISPNPAADYFSFDLKQKGLIEIVSLNGTLVFSQELEAGIQQVASAEWASGIYLIQFNGASIGKVSVD